MPRPEDLIYGMGGFAPAFGQIDAQRSGNVDIPLLRGMGGQDLAALDRYAQMGQYGQDFGPEAPFYKRMLAPAAGVLGTGLLAGNEISKMLPNDLPYGLTPYGIPLSQKWLGNFDPSFTPGQATSRPSLNNFLSGMGGLIEGMVPGLIR